MSLAALVMTAALAVSADSTSPASIEETAQQALSALPGETAFLFTELGDNGPRTLAALRADDDFAVGSSFKLYILGTLIDEVNAGRRRTYNTMPLTRELEGPPASEMAGWPIGSPVTLHTLALKMISISDNTATDHLLYLLGRERVERQMAAMGHSDPALNRPLLSTREMTMLRDKNRGLPGREYQKLDVEKRRAMLAKLDAGPPNYDNLDFDTAAYNIAEWYASPEDMARALAWIKQNTEEKRPADEIRAILAVDPKLAHDAARWPFVGFKGGSEDQLIAGNWLLANQNGRWYTLHVFWNNPDGPAPPEEFIVAVDEIFAAIDASLKSSS